MYQLPPWVWPSAVIATCALAVWRGRDQERLAAGVYLAAWALTLVVFRSRTDDMQWPVFIIDTCLLVILIALALRSARYWPLFAAAFQLLCVVTHIARALDAAVSGWAYQTAGLIWSYMIIAAIAYGSWSSPQRYAEIEAADPKNVPGATRR